MPSLGSARGRFCVTVGAVGIVLHLLPSPFPATSTNGAKQRSPARLSSELAVAQVALSLILLVSAGLFVHSFNGTQLFDPSFNPRNVLLQSYDLFPNGYTQAEGMTFDRQVLDSLEVYSGTISGAIPFRVRRPRAEVQFPYVRNDAMQVIYNKN
jgi:hypothetical protein